MYTFSLGHLVISHFLTKQSTHAARDSQLRISVQPKCFNCANVLCSHSMQTSNTRECMSTVFFSYQDFHCVSNCVPQSWRRYYQPNHRNTFSHVHGRVHDSYVYFWKKQRGKNHSRLSFFLCSTKNTCVGNVSEIEMSGSYEASGHKL